MSLKKCNIKLTNDGDEFIILFNFFGKNDCLTTKIDVFQDKNLYIEIQKFLQGDDRDALFFGPLQKDDILLFYHMTLPGGTPLQGRRNGASISLYAFLIEAEEHIMKMEIENNPKFVEIKDIIISDPFRVIFRLTRHISLMLDHINAITTIHYICFVVLFPLRVELFAVLSWAGERFDK
jgi:hypothetical protein